jgi:hypothetical protein
MPSPIPYEPSDLVVSYKERVVAYLDILNIRNISNCSEKVSIIVNLVRDAIFEQEKILGLHDSCYLQVSFISDSIVISVDAPSSADNPQIRNILKFAGGFGLSLLSLGFPCRGSMVTGQIFHYRDREVHFDTVVGPALVNAVKLEESIARYPRIIVDTSVYNLWEKFIVAETDEQDSWREVLKRDTKDNQWFINIFHEKIVTDVNAFFLYKILSQKKDFDIFKEVGKCINNGLTLTNATDVQEKYEWLQYQYLPYSPLL